MTHLTQQKYLELIADFIKFSEGRLLSSRTCNVTVDDLVRLQAGNGPSGHGAEHVWARIEHVTRYNGASAMLANQRLRDHLLGPGVSKQEGLEAYCDLATCRYTALDLNQDQNEYTKRAASLVMHKTLAEKDAWLRSRGIRPLKYKQAEIDSELRLIVKRGQIGCKRDSLASHNRPDAKFWDAKFTADPEMQFVVWDLTPEIIHLSTRP
jgi:hypothetical protein